MADNLMPMVRQRSGGIDPRNFISPQAPYLDLLQCAWRLTDSEMERFLRLPPAFIWHWRNNYVRLNTEQLRWIEQLADFHDALMLVVPISEADPGPPRYGEYLRQRWSEQSPIGARSILEAVFEDGPEIVPMLTQFFWAQQ